MPYKDKEKQKEYLKRYHKKYYPKYYQEHKKKLLEYRKEYKLENKERQDERREIWDKRYVQTHRIEVKKQRIMRRSRFKNAGELTIKTIQLVYEDNIKKYGTLTCEYCKNLIEFGKDTLDHKIPLSRKGTNDYENLCVACRRCNCSKGTKTVEEFMEYLMYQVILEDIKKGGIKWKE